MSFQDVSPYLDNAPVYEDLLEIQKDVVQLNDAWANWFDDVVFSTGQCITHDFVISPSGERDDFPMLMATQGTMAERNSLENARDGSVFFNTDTKEFNFRQNGQWVKFSPIPA
jgi:hypothetical protein